MDIVRKTHTTVVLYFLNIKNILCSPIIEVNAIGLVQATSPFVQAEYLKQAANKLFGNGTFQSVFSVTRTHQLRWTVEGIRLHEGDVSTTKPMNFNPYARPRRQDWSGEMVENGMFYFAKRPVLVGNHVFQADGFAKITFTKQLVYNFYHTSFVLYIGPLHT